jgi:propionyl-CoA carboxylase beta chain
MTLREELLEKTQRALEGGGVERVAKQHSAGKLTARERILLLVDPGSFVEFDQLASNQSSHGGESFFGDGVITGRGLIDGRQVFLFAQDFTVFGGSLATMHAKKICKVMDLAVQTGCPIIGFNDSGGARIQEGVESLAGYADIFLRNTLASGVVPQLSLIMGPCAGGAVYSPAITDFVLMVESHSYMFITGPEVIKAVTKEEVTKEHLGGAYPHSAISGIAHLSAPSDEDIIAYTRELLSFIPQNNTDGVIRKPTGDLVDRESQLLASIIPENPHKPYDMKGIIKEIADDNYFFETQPLFAQNIITGFIRLDGWPVGVVANQPSVLAGCLDCDASVKAARFVRFCDAFGIPLLTLVDVPGFLPGVDQEHRGIIRHGAKLLYAYAEATVPKVTVITRKAYGGAYDVMSSKHLRGDINLAYPTAEVAVMGPEGAVNILHKRELDEMNDPAEFTKKRDELAASYRREFANPWQVAALGFIDAVILPENTRQRVIEGFSMTRGKRLSNPPKRHGNIPL